MKPYQTRNLFLLLVMLATGATSGCGFVNGLRAKSALNDGARAYKSADFETAEAEFRRSLELDPDQDNARTYLARAIERQYKPTGVNTPENDRKAEQALATYREILQRDAGNDAAYSGVTRMLGYMKQTDEQRQFVTQRANAETLANDKRSEAFTFLASKEWRCTNDINEQQTNKQTVQREGKTVIEYKKPTEEADFQRTQQCATGGLGFAERAVSLNPNNELAWSFKANLLLEKAKIAQMEGSADAKANFERQAEEARQKNEQLTEQKRQQKEAEEQRKQQERASS